jgi:hypothetical protein
MEEGGKEDGGMEDPYTLHPIPGSRTFKINTEPSY